MWVGSWKWFFIKHKFGEKWSSKVGRQINWGGIRASTDENLCKWNLGGRETTKLFGVALF